MLLLALVQNLEIIPCEVILLVKHHISIDFVVDILNYEPIFPVH